MSDTEDPSEPARPDPAGEQDAPSPPLPFGRALSTSDDEPLQRRRVRRSLDGRRRRGNKGLAVVLGVLAAIVVGFGGVSWYVLHDMPHMPADESLWASQRAPGITFQDNTGKVIATRGPKAGVPVRLEALPPHVPKAFLAAEDRRFYMHGALDIKGMARAFVINLRSGRVVQGGSTITQQIAKTLFLSPERTLKRKLQEAVIAYRLERRMTKDEVLELYLSRVFFGANAYGLDAAAQTYFGRGAGALTLPEAALLAGLPQAPSRLALDKNMPAALERSRLVLAIMREEGWITPAEEQLALAEPPKLAPPPPGEGDIGYVLDMAAAEATKIAGENAPDLVIRLTIDTGLQTVAQDVVRRVIAGDGRRAGASQAALVALTPDGAIRALVGGTDHRTSPFNRAVQAKRQPGSSFKPFVYAAALEMGVRPEDVRRDEPVRFGDWRPANYGGGYRGSVTVENALALSINTVAVKLAAEAGQTKVAEVARRFGLSSIPPSPNLSVALGAYEVSLLDLTGAYGVFQNAGQRHEPYLITSITSPRGDVIYQRPPPVEKNVYARDYAGHMVRMLKAVVERGTGTRAGFGRPAAGKTGTSQNWRDAWFVGFTPDWNVGVWVGNDDDTPMTSRSTGGAVPAAIWREVMIAAHGQTPVNDFDFIPPPAVQEIELPWLTDVEFGEPIELPADVRPEPRPEPRPAPPPRDEFYDDLASDFSEAAEPPRRPRPPRPDEDFGPPRGWFDR